MIGADLMPEAARARMERDGDLILEQTEGLGRRGVEDPSHILNLGKVVTGAQSAQLSSSPVQRSIGDQIRPCPSQATTFFHELEIAPLAHSLIDRPGGSLGQDGLELPVTQSKVAAALPDAGRDVAIEMGDELAELRLDVGATQT